MHEMSLAEGVLQLIEDAARKDPFTEGDCGLAGNWPALGRGARSHGILF